MQKFKFIVYMVSTVFVVVPLVVGSCLLALFSAAQIIRYYPLLDMKFVLILSLCPVVFGASIYFASFVLDWSVE